ncbi:MAG: hypothetical protein R2853_11060 [Thermomicrobiales bacterium]
MQESAAENLEDFAQVWPPLVQYARGRGIKLAIENCPDALEGHLPGGSNVAYSPPSGARCSEIIPDDNFGLNYDRHISSGG